MFGSVHFVDGRDLQGYYSLMSILVGIIKTVINLQIV